MDPLTIRALIGLASAAVGAAGSYFGRTEESTKQIPKFTPGQQSAQNELLQMALQGLRDPQQGSQFGPIADQARSQFNQRTIPSIAERFTAADAQRGSGFQQALGQAGSGLEEQLAALQSQYDMSRLNQFLSMANLGLGEQFDTQYNPGGETPTGKFFGALGGAGVNYAMNSFGNQNNQNNQGGGLPPGFGQTPNMPDYSNPQQFADLLRRNRPNVGGYNPGSPYMYNNQGGF